MINNRQHNITQSFALVVGKCEQYLIFTSSSEIAHYIVSSVFFFISTINTHLKYMKLNILLSATENDV